MMKRSIWTVLLLVACLPSTTGLFLHRRAAPTPPPRRPLKATLLECSTSLLRLRGGSELPQLFSETDLDVELENAGSNVLVVVDFFATWCGPCKKIAPILEQLAASTEKSGKVKFFAVDVDQARELAAEKGVRSMPTILFYKNEKLIKTIVGGDIAGIKAEVSKATTPALLAYLRSETLMLAAALAYMGVTLTPLKRVLPPALQFA